jgi:undecaprenyl-diphosphatase
MLAALFAATATRWSTKRAAWSAAVLVTALVGVSRLYLGAHWLTDVLGGWALGALWLAALLTTVRTVAARRAERVGAT